MIQRESGIADQAGAADANAPGGLDRVLAERITKRLGSRNIVRSVDLRVPPRERLVIFGHNGAGKTTLLRILATLSRPTSGSLTIDGLSATGDAQQVRRLVGVVAHQTYLYDDLTAWENLRFFGRMYDVPNLTDRIGEVLVQLGLINRRDDRVRTFSRGMQQRLAIARAILHRPPLLLLDEPDTGLDRQGIDVLARLLALHSAEGGSVVLTTHDTTLGLLVADRVMLMEHGRMVLDRPAADVNCAEIDRRLAGRL